MTQAASDDIRFMRRAIELAERGKASTWPNPMVGCVVVKEGCVVSEGWHERPGGPHAEAAAIAEAGADAQGATVYVTLEPFAHHARTPPCTEALIAAGISRLVVAARDPNPIAGGGAELVRQAGVQVEVGLLGERARKQNEPFFVVHEKGRPFVLFKYAMTADGKIATANGDARWISGEAARHRVHEWRGTFDGIAVGVNTVLRDNPLLTCRLEGHPSPVKIVFDSAARTPAQAALFEPDTAGRAAQVIIYVSDSAPKRRVELLAERADVVTTSSQGGRPKLPLALADLKSRGILSVLLEGGGTLAWSFVEEELVDKVAVFLAPKLLGGSGPTPVGGRGVPSLESALALKELVVEQVADDLLITGSIVYAGNESRGRL